MKLFLVRHGQSIGNSKPGFISGRSDPDGLTVGGKAQIIRAAWNLKKSGISAPIYTSPVTRARESAGIIGNLLGQPIQEAPFLEEFNYGRFEGSFWWTQSEADRQAWSTAMADFSTPIPGGDSYETFSDRLWQGYQNFLSENSELNSVILVSHDAVISTLLFSILYGHPAKQDTTSSYKKAYLRFINSVRVSNGSVTVVDLEQNPVEFAPLNVKESSVPIFPDSIQFYMNGMWQMEEVEMEEQYTASENKVFHIRSNTKGKTAIIKLLEEREIVSSERMVDIYTYLKDKTEISAPNILFYDKSNSFFEDTVLVQDYLDGSIQTDFANQYPELIEPMLEDTFRVIKKIHSIPVQEVEEFWYPEDASPHNVHAPWHLYMKNEIERTQEKISTMKLPSASSKKLKSTLDSVAAYVTSKSYTCTPLHGDIIPMNIIFSKSQKGCCCVRFLDFERARIGDPLWDYAYYYASMDLFLPAGVPFWEKIIKSNFSKEEVRRIESFRVLFHAWTIRDKFDYEGSALRADRANNSKKWLIGAL